MTCAIVGKHWRVLVTLPTVDLLLSICLIAQGILSARHAIHHGQHMLCVEVVSHPLIGMFDNVSMQNACGMKCVLF